MAEEEVVATESPSGDAEGGGGSDEASQAAEGGEQEGLHGGESSEAASEGGEAAETTRPAGDDILQHPKVQEALSRLQSTKDTELAAVRRELRQLQEGLQKPAEQPPDERAQIQARLKELEVELEAMPYDGARLREAARLEARLETIDRLGQESQQQTFQTVRNRGLEILRDHAPVLWAEPGTEDWPKAQEMSAQMRAISEQAGIRGHALEPLLSYALLDLYQRKHQLEAAKAQGALAENKRKEKVNQAGQLGGGKGKATDLGLTPGQLQRAKDMGVRAETMARVVKGMKTNTGGMTVES